MTMKASDTLQAERHIRFRILASTMIAFGLIANFYTSYAVIPVGWGDYVHLLTGPMFAVFLILFLANGQEHVWSNAPTVQRLMGDESTVENRRLAQSFGFWAMIPIGVAIGLVSLLWLPMPGHKAVQLVLTLALSAAAQRFAILEQRALNL
jgi:hypothetical protein